MSGTLPPFVIRGFRWFGTWIPVLLLAACAHTPQPDMLHHARSNPPMDGTVVKFEPPQLPQGFGHQERLISGDPPPFSGSIAWPRMTAEEPGHEVYNAAVEALIKGAEEEFLAGLDPEVDPSLPGSSFSLGYGIAWADSNVVSVRLPVDLYHTGAAHPFHYEMTLVVDRRAGRVLELEDLFLPETPWLETLSRLSTAELSERLEDSFFPEGTEARPENFDCWLLAEHTLTLLFDPYEVGPWVAGPQEVEISLADLQSLLAPGIAKP